MKVMKALVRVSAVSLLFIATAAQADGLQPAANSLKNLTTALMVVVPFAATLTLVVVGVMYLKSMIERQTLVNWVVGCLIAGSASAITSFFFGGG